MATLFVQRSLIPKGCMISYGAIRSQGTSRMGVTAPLLRIWSPSSSLIIRFVDLEGEFIKLSLEGHTQKFDMTEIMAMDNQIIFDAKHGRFAVPFKVVLNEELGEKILSRWRQVSFVGKYVDIMRRADLNIISVQLDCIVFEYQEGQQIVLSKISNQTCLTFSDPCDPAQRLTPFLTRRMEMDGLHTVIERLRACQYILPIFSEIESDNVTVLFRDAGSFLIEYHSQNHGILICFRRRNKAPMFHITDMALKKYEGNTYSVVEFCRQLWQESTNEVVGLGNGIAVSPAKAADILRTIHAQIVS